MPAFRLAIAAAVAMPLVLVSPVAAQAQRATDSLVTIGLTTEAPHLRFSASSPATAAMPHFDEPDSLLPCPQCYPKTHFWVAVAELVALQVIPNAFSRITSDAEWAKVSLNSWGNNLTLPWQWDNNNFKNNQFSHPYHGAMYFNAARTNGYNFWKSAPWSFVGSLTWELFGEVWAPAPNDLLNTTLGGITLGEMLYRVSSLTLKNESHGFERVAREVTAGLLNPVRGFNRVVRGEAWEVSRTPPDWRPSTVFGSVDAGYRRFSESSNLSGASALDQVFLSAELRYGSETFDLGKRPFSFFQVQGALASNNGNAGRLTELMVRGGLAAKPLGGDSGQRQLALFMTYSYINNPVIAFGAQGFSGGPVWNIQPSHGPSIHVEALGTAMPIAAIRSDYYLTAEGRDYDYGIGLGGGGSALLVWKGTGVFGATARYVFVPVISGFPGTHQILTTNVGGRVYWKGRLGIGAEWVRLWSWNIYYGRTNVNRNASELRLYLSTAVPRWGAS